MDANSQSGIRLQKALAEAGVASRRAAEEMIRRGQVTVNGKLVDGLGIRVSLDDEIRIDGQRIGSDQPKVYIALHKPRGYISTARDTHHRPSVVELVSHDVRVFPVGRLDLDSEGLILLTNDGDFANALLHPSHAVTKEYLAQVDGLVSPQVLNNLARGVWLEDGPTQKMSVEPIQGKSGANWIRMSIQEGRNRQIRRMCAAVGLRVCRLVRVAIGPLRLGNLGLGKYRFLRGNEVKQLRRHVTEAISLQVIAIDGPAASGKTALARKLAQRLGWRWLDTGMLYRALTAFAHIRQIDPYDNLAVTRLARQSTLSLLVPDYAPPNDMPRILVDGEDVTDRLYSAAVDADVSAVAANSEVRRALLPKQRDIANQGKIIVVGRDIGTVVLPRAPLKIYLDASPEVRARRRHAQIEKAGQEANLELILADLYRRDNLDRERPNAPLLVAKDAKILHTDDMTIAQEIEVIIQMLRQGSAEAESE